MIYRNKIRTNYNSVINNKNKIDNFQKSTVKNYNYTYCKSQLIYETEWNPLYGTITITINFLNLPQELISFIKVIPILKTESGFISDSYKTFSLDFNSTIEEKNGNYFIHLMANNIDFNPLYIKFMVIINNPKYFYELRTNQ